MCLDLLRNVSKLDPAIANSFYQNFYIYLLQEIFSVLTDTEHKSGFKLQALILAHLFEVVVSGRVSAPLFDPSTAQFPDNATFIQDYSQTLLRNAFPHLQPAQIETFVRGLLDLNADNKLFQLHLRDFLITLKEFSGDNEELYREEQELEKDRKQQAIIEAAKQVPGLLKPVDVDSD